MAVKKRLVQVALGHEDEVKDGGFVKIAITPSFPYCIKSFLKSSYDRPDPAILSTTLLQKPIIFPCVLVFVFIFSQTMRVFSKSSMQLFKTPALLSTNFARDIRP